jgi:hypothetical protein
MLRKVQYSLFLLTFFAAVSPVAATDYSPLPVYEEPPIELRGSYFEIGARYWYSAGQTDFDLYDDTGGILVSRLTYEGLDAHSGEIFFHSQHESGVFVKGYGGLGIIPSGSLNDEDFPPVIDPYSSTMSSLEDGNIKYLSADIGFPFLEFYGRTGRFQLAGFTGYHYWNEAVHAFGCDQTAANPAICVPTIPTTAKVISNEAKWHSWRVGLMGSIDAGNGLKLTGEAAWVPYTRLDNTDNHHLRPDIDPLPSDGDGDGLQLEAVLSYDINERVSIGAGARYWRLGRTEGHAHFEDTPGGGIAQVVKFQSERFGGFVQASVKLY